MKRRYSIWFVSLAGGVLALTGLAKVCASFGSARMLALADPITGITFRGLLPVVGLAEIAIAMLCFVPQIGLRLKVGLVAWLATNIFVYRLGLWAVNWHHPCSCMGSLAGVLHLSDQAADNIMKGILAFMLVGSYLLLFAEWRRKPVSPDFPKP